jgi:hypothetical protein
MDLGLSHRMIISLSLCLQDDLEDHVDVTNSRLEVIVS